MNQPIKKQSAEEFLQECSKELQTLSEKLWNVGDLEECSNVDCIVAGQVAGVLDYLSAQLMSQAVGKGLAEIKLEA